MAGFTPLQKVLYQPLTFGTVLSLAGIAFFLMAVSSALVDAAASSAASVLCTSEMVSVCFRAAGWFVGSGWLLQRCEAGSWPFKGALQRTRPQGGSLARITAFLCLTVIALGILLSLVVVR